tara:strand:- start:658 stop:1761 length:1104 start_codon:yes stop_codon:yes gene_type:complete
LRILVTGADGFIGKNLCLKLTENRHDIIKFNRSDSDDNLDQYIKDVDFIFHLAGENRPISNESFELVNIGLTKKLASCLKKSNNRSTVIFSSSSQATASNPYGESKYEAEKVLQSLSNDNGNPLRIYRLPGIFGKWAKPNYNSVVATFCHNISRNQPITISDPKKELELVYIDQVIESFLSCINDPSFNNEPFVKLDPYKISLKNLADAIHSFKDSRLSHIIPDVGSGIMHALYATYLTHLPISDSAYSLKSSEDQRGIFAEVLKSKSAGQFSFFTTKPGMTRGGHYHHSKTEKFIILQGSALFKFKHTITNEFFELNVGSDTLQVVDTIPGWVHDITNTGMNDLIVMLWANEIFNKDLPDTIAHEI